MVGTLTSLKRRVSSGKKKSGGKHKIIRSETTKSRSQLDMFQVKVASSVTIDSSVLTALPLETDADNAPRLPRRTKFEPRDIAPKIPLRSFRTIDLGQLSRAPPTRGLSRSHSRSGGTALNKLHIPGQSSVASTDQDVQVFKSLPLSDRQKAALMRFCINWWEA